MSPFFIMNRNLFLILLCLGIISCSTSQKNEDNFINSDSMKVEPSLIVDSVKYEPAENTQLQKEIPEEKDEQDYIENKIDRIPDVDFVKGIYLTAYKVASRDFENILNVADSAGINTVIFDLKNMNGDVFFRMHQKLPLAGDNIKPIVNIKKTVKTLHGMNMKAVSRVVMFHDQFNAQRDSLLRPHVFSGSSWKESEKRKPSWLDSSNPIVQNYLLTLVEEISQNGVDEIQLDYIRFPTQGNISKAIFTFQQTDSLLFARDSTYVFRNKADIIADFLARAKRICDRYDVKLTADVFAIVAWQRNADIMATGQNMRRMTQNLDFVHPMIYSSHFASDFGYREDIYNEPYFIMYKGTKLTVNNTIGHCKVVPYIQSNSWRVNYKKEYMIAQIKAIEDCGASGYILWNASNRYKKTLSWIREYYETE
jgi:hypothetical protein